MLERFSKEARAQKKLAAAFNNAAKMEEALTKLQKENPKFEFLKEKNEKGAYFITNIPIRMAGKTDDMSIDITSGGILLTVNSFSLVRPPVIIHDVSTRSIKRATRIVRRHMAERGLAS